jgi:hypothetical protein
MSAAPAIQNRLLAQSGREFDLWQPCHEFPEKSSKSGSLITLNE